MGCLLGPGVLALLLAWCVRIIFTAMLLQPGAVEVLGLAHRDADEPACVVAPVAAAGVEKRSR